MVWLKWLKQVEDTHEAAVRTRETVSKLANAVGENGRLGKELLKTTADALQLGERTVQEMRALQLLMTQQTQALMFATGLSAIRAYETDGMTEATRLMLDKAVEALERSEGVAPLDDADRALLDRLRRAAGRQAGGDAAPGTGGDETGVSPAS